MTTITDVQTTQVYQVFIKATPEAIWDAITKPEFTRKYFYGTEVDSRFEPGAPYVQWGPGHESSMIEGEILESDPPRRLSTTWLSVWDEEQGAEQPSRVTWEIESGDDGVTLLTVVHDRLEDAPKTAASVSGGWMRVLSGLKTLLETGEPL